MKYLFIYLLLVTSLWGQTTQGGPPQDDLRSDLVVNWLVDDESIIQMIDPLAQNLFLSVKKSSESCFDSKTSKNLEGLPDFYLFLLNYLVIENLKTVQDQQFSAETLIKCCIEDDCTNVTFAQIKCLRTNINQKSLFDFLNSSQSQKYLQLKLKISASDAQYLMKLTQELLKK